MARNLALGRPIAETVIRPGTATDGQVSGYDSRGGYTYFAWPGYLTVDLGEVCQVAAIRLLLWDGLGTSQGARDPRSYKYRVLTSMDHRTWKVLFDTGGDSYSGWQVFNLVPAIDAQYVRIHGLWNSANAHFHVVELEAFDESPRR